MKYQPTSRDAWRSFLPVSAELDRAICFHLEICGASICQHIEEAIGRSHQAVSGNLRHLVEHGAVEESGTFGLTSSGRRAIKWRLRIAPPAPPPRPAVQGVLDL